MASTTITTTTTETSITTRSKTVGCCSRPCLDPLYYRGIPGVLKLLEAVFSLIAYICVELAPYYCPTQLSTTPGYFKFIALFSFFAALILWGLLLFKMPQRILRCDCVNWPFMEMVFYAGLIVFYFFGDLFMSIYSSGCTNMDSQRAGTAFGWFALIAFIVDLVFLVRLFIASRRAPPASAETGTAKY